MNPINATLLSIVTTSLIELCKDRVEKREGE